MSKLYLDNGYLNMAYIWGLDTPFTFVIGGRGTGKTYGGLQELLKEKGKFLLLRRTQAQADIISKDEFNPFKVLLPTLDYEIHTDRVSKYITNVQRTTTSGEMETIGYISAVSTFANIRGFDLSDVTTILYDEFIPEKHQLSIKNEAMAVFNIYETVNRNRELSGQPPTKFLALSNSDTVNNDLFISLHIVDKVLQMQSHGNEILRIPKQNLTVINLRNSHISDRKRKTALYQLTAVDEKFSNMALSNKFGDIPDNIKSQPLQEYNIDCVLCGMGVYRHKSMSKYYVCNVVKGTTPYQYDDSDRDRTAFKLDKPYLLRAYYNKLIDFSDGQTSLTFRKVLKL